MLCNDFFYQQSILPDTNSDSKSCEKFWQLLYILFWHLLFIYLVGSAEEAYCI